MDGLDGTPSHLLGYQINGRIRILFYWIIPTCLELVAYLIQMSSDFGVTFQHFKTNNHLFGGLTLLFICLPAVISFILIISMPEQYPLKGHCNNENMKFIFYQFCSFIIFPIWAIYRFCRRIFWSIESLFYDKDMFERHHCVSIAAESSPFELYHFVQAYAQSAPQIILQLFILLRENIFRNYETSNIQVVSIIFSLINLSMITVSFQRFESQKIVGGRSLPWATFDNIKKLKKTLQYSTEKRILSTAGKRQSSISLNNNKRNQQKYRQNSSLYFPENDKIFHNFQLQISTTSDTPLNEPILNKSKFIQVKNYNHDIHDNETTKTFMNSSYTSSADDEIDFVNRKKILSTEKIILKEILQNENDTMMKNNNSNDEESLLFLDKNNNGKVFLAYTNCNDPIPKIVKKFSIDDTEVCLNITDDDKFLKNCQNINNNMNNNDDNIEDGIITTAAEIATAAPISTNQTSKENVKILENLDRLQIVGTKSENNSLMLNNGSQVKNFNCKNRYSKDEQNDINDIVLIGEEMLNINPKENIIQRNSFAGKIYIDKVPDLPAPPPPPSPLPTIITSTTAGQILPQKLGNRPKSCSLDNIEYRTKEEQLNNMNKLNRLSAFKDMLISKTENYIIKNVPHPPRYLIDKKNSINYQNKNNTKNLLNDNKNLTIGSDTVDFFYPQRRKTINGIEQDDFIGKFVAFFGWFMFIYMRMLSLSSFSIFYLNEFFYIIIVHYIFMLIILLIDFNEFYKNLKNLPIYIFLSYVYIFVLIEFNIKFHKIRYWYGGYIIIILLENFIITLIWYENFDFESWWFEYIFLTIIFSGLLFIVCMIVYYYLLRPNDVMLLEKL